MTDSNTTKSVRDRLDRRAFLGAIGVASVPSLAGCFGDPEQTPGGDEDGQEGDQTPEDDQEDDQTPEDGSDDEETPGQGDDGNDGDQQMVEEEPDYEGWFDDVSNYDGTQDFRDGNEASVDVGAGDESIQFEPPAIMVRPGTTVEWVWTGEGGSHNVVHEDGEFESELSEEEGNSFTHTFEEAGMYRYVCEPHESQGMKGAVVVDEDQADGEDQDDGEDANNSG